MSKVVFVVLNVCLFDFESNFDEPSVGDFGEVGFFLGDLLFDLLLWGLFALFWLFGDLTLFGVLGDLAPLLVGDLAVFDFGDLVFGLFASMFFFGLLSFLDFGLLTPFAFGDLAPFNFGLFAFFFLGDLPFGLVPFFLTFFFVLSLPNVSSIYYYKIGFEAYHHFPLQSFPKY